MHLVVFSPLNKWHLNLLLFQAAAGSLPDLPPSTATKCSFNNISVCLSIGLGRQALR